MNFPVEDIGRPAWPAITVIAFTVRLSMVTHGRPAR